ncbi:MAG TPA: hypothetical protein VGB56_03120, partial [Flavisolibacter sp.]
MKHLLLFLLGALNFPDSFAQPLEKQKPQRDNSRPKQTAPTVTIQFKANHDFYLTINGTTHDKISGGEVKAIKLKDGLYKLSFEEADSTGEKLDHVLRVTA